MSQIGVVENVSFDLKFSECYKRHPHWALYTLAMYQAKMAIPCISCWLPHTRKMKYQGQLVIGYSLMGFLICSLEEIFLFEDKDHENW